MNPRQRILVVDDNNETRRLCIDLLARAGYDVEGVKDGATGWEELQNCRDDLVITDNAMPRMTGIEMTAKLYSTCFSLVSSLLLLPMAKRASMGYAGWNPRNYPV